MTSERGLSTARRMLDLADLLQPGKPDWTLVDLIAVLRRRSSYLLVSTGGMLVLATLYCLLATPRFRASGEIEVEKEAAAAFGLENSVAGKVESNAPDSLDYSMTLETQAKILQSSTLALQVIKELKLEATSDYFPVHASGLRIPAWLLFWQKPLEPTSVSLDHAPNRRYVALKIFSKQLKVTPEAGTRLIEVTYSDPDPELAAAVVNRLLQALTDYIYQSRSRATTEASAWLASQLAVLGRQTKSLDDKANRLQRDTGIYKDKDIHSVILDRLNALNMRVTVAESNRLMLEAIDRVSQTGDPELISALAGSTLTLGTPALVSSVTLLQTLRARESETRAQIAETDVRYGPAHPRIAELHAQLEGIEGSIHEEVMRIGQRSHADLEIAQASELSAQDAFDKQRALADQVSGKSAAYQMAQDEADGTRGVYQQLLAKLKAAAVLEGLRSTNLTVVTPGLVPPPNRPKSPNFPLSYAAALVGGLFLGTLSALASELADNTVRSLAGLERLTGSQLLGALPHLRSERKMQRLLLDTSTGPTLRGPVFLAANNDPPSLIEASFLEALRSLRTSLLLLRGGHRSQVVLVTSSIAGEGKSKIAVNLAGVLAQLGARVLLVDGDLRRPSVHRQLHMHGSDGLGAALIHDGDAAIRVYGPLPNLSVLCGCDAVRMPAELLASSRMFDLLREWRVNFDFVVLDSPPLLPATDALVLSQLSDITLLIARHGFTPKQAVHRAVSTLQNQIPETCLMRVVLNDVHSGSYDFREYYGYEPRATPVQ
jgi:polysaccharide biosynthesis transport protein